MQRAKQDVTKTNHCHSRGFLSAVSTTFKNKSGGDPRQRHSGMTPNLMGFTLIELLVVVLIIGILAAVALPQYNKAVKKAQGREVLVALEAMDTALTDYYLQYGNYQNITVDKLSVTLPELKYFRYNVGSACSDSSQKTTVTDSFFSWNVNQSPSTFQMWLCGPIGVSGVWSQQGKSFYCSYERDEECKEYFGNCTPGGGGCEFFIHK